MAFDTADSFKTVLAGPPGVPSYSFVILPQWVLVIRALHQKQTNTFVHFHNVTICLAGHKFTRCSACNGDSVPDIPTFPR